VARGHLEAHDAKDMAACAHVGGFSVDAGVCIKAVDRAGLERLLRYCARPPEDANARAGTAAAAVALGGPGGVQAEPDRDLATQSPPDYPDDQRTAW